MNRKCSVEECDGKHYGKGYCRNHYRKMFRKMTGSICSVEGCDSRVDSRGLCPKHLARLKRGNDIEAVTRSDRNEIIINGDVARLVLRDAHGIKTGEAIVCDRCRQD